MSLMGPLQSSHWPLLTKNAGKGRLVGRALFCDLPIIWVVFILKRLLLLGVFCHLVRVVVMFSPAWGHPEHVEWRVLTHYWGLWWNGGEGHPLTGLQHLWFLSCLALFWIASPPVAALIFMAPEWIALLMSLGLLIYGLFAITVFPKTNDWPRYYFSPQTHWQSYAIGLFLWRSRTSPLINDVVQNIPWYFLVVSSLLVDAACGVFVWWQHRIIVHRYRPENDFADEFYMTTSFMAVIVMLWSMPLSDYSLCLKFSSAQWWGLVCPGAVVLAVFVTQWPINSFVLADFHKKEGRCLCLMLTFFFSILFEAYFFTPLRRLLTPYFNKMSKFAES
eukprot:Protomagalhaensia_sp_Gyna_25__4266@NODE_388_length_3606_cov_47_708719_g298_i0_p2_GENE_NODE_388_length_3606_cov_47_708719_g298_i0NODE_388_length_3606_cov_47_708719_g298_i0_p2_ORF_typecomplete_len333_score20_58Acyl_transf_3/PF01757_22/3_2e07HupE_UreJ/PF04955_12/0_079_NODE_388_length_3606_cov_47_708719_g298_i016372635